MKSADLMNLMLYVSYLGVLLLVGKFLRVKVKLFQKLFLPASLIAGFLGIILGPYMLKIISADVVKLWGMLPGRLIDVVFACVFLGAVVPSARQIWQYGGPQLTYSWFVDACQWVLGIGIGYFILKPIWDIPPMVGTIIEIGWAGGHGTAGGMTQVFKNLGFPEGGDLGLTSATVGLLVGIIFGMILINIAVRKGYTEVLTSPEQIGQMNLSGILPDEEKKVIAKSVVTTDSIEPFALHSGLIGLSILLGYYMHTGLKMLHPKLASVPLFPLAMIGGLLIQYVAYKTGTSRLIDRQVVERIQGTALDFLVTAAVASISVPVVIKYALPLLILMGAALALMLFLTWYIAPRMLPDAWFERSIAEFGALCGVLAVGLLLLRVVDPDFKTSAPKAFAFERPFFSPFVGGGLVTSVIPIMVHEMGALPVIGIWLGVIVLTLGIAYFSGWMRPHPGPYRRQGSASV